MSHLEVNGLSIGYELVGNGTPVVWTEGGYSPRNHFSYFFAGRCSANNQVLIWDRPCSGESDFAVKDTPSDWYMWAELLHEMCKKLDLLPAFFGGGSAGSELSLLMAHLFPKDVTGLILHCPSNIDSEIGRMISKYHYLALAEAADKGGMAAVLEASTTPPDQNGLARWIAESANANPENRRRILSTDSELFSKIMRRWNDWIMSPRFHCSNLTDEELHRVDVPAIVSHGFDPAHPPEVAKDLFDRLPNAEWVDFQTRWTKLEMDQLLEDSSPALALMLYLPFYDDFIKRVETETFESYKK